MSVLKIVRSNPNPKPAALPWIDQDTVRRLRLDQEPSKRVADGDPKAKGLKLRKQGAALSFVFEAKAQGKAVAITLGSADTLSPDEAREQARKLRKAVDQGKDPRLALTAQKAAVAAQEATQREAEAMTLRKAIELKQASGLRPRAAMNYSALLSRKAQVNLLALADRPLASISKTEWRGVLADAAEKYGPGSTKAWTIKRSVAAVYRHAISVSDHLDIPNPISSIAVERNARRKTGRLEAKALAGWFAQLSHLHPTAGNLARMYLFTGARDKEVRELQWNEIEPDCIRIPAERTKTHAELLIPRTPAIDVILEVQGKLAGPAKKRRTPYVFPGIGPGGKGSKWERPIASILPTLKQLGCTVHDMRRTVATFLDQLGVPENIRRHLLNHSPDISRGYVQRDLTAMRKELMRYHDWLANERQRQASESREMQEDEAAGRYVPPTAEELAADAELEAYDRAQARERWL